MNYLNRKVFVTLSCIFALAGHIQAAMPNDSTHTTHLMIDGRSGGKAVSSTMWGIFFEDINFAADGGIYGELVKNRSFEFDDPFMGWKQLRKEDARQPQVSLGGKVLITNKGNNEPHNGNHRYAHISINHYFGLENEGFRGMGFVKNEPYRFTGNFRLDVGQQIELQLLIVDSAGHIFTRSDWKPLPATGEWVQYSDTLTAKNTVEKGHLRLLLKGNGQLDADMLSLFPVHTWKNRPGGLRKDLVQKLYDLHPGFIRFPGGCIVEGRTLVNRYQWKNTVGPVAERTTISNRWQTEFKAPRNAPDYYQSYGLGFFEYFQLAEDLGAAPLPILNCGMACQFNSGEVAADLEPYIQDALDLIEFANGDTSTTFGRLRARMGHPGSFHLQYLGVGNEQWDTQYFDRYKIFESRLRTAHPEIQLVSGSGPYNSGEWFDTAWTTLRRLHPSLIDEHYYAPPEWFLKNAGRYDTYDRKGPKVFAGEYAAHGKASAAPESANSFYSALTEAAFMTGLERNADIVRMASYAPLLANVNAWQWRPDLIWFDNLTSIATPNYYVQQIFSLSKGTEVLPTTSGNAPLKGQDSLYASTTFDSRTGQTFIKLVNVSGRAKSLQITLRGLRIARNAVGKWTLLHSDSAYRYNSLQEPDAIQPIYLSFGEKQQENKRPGSPDYALPRVQSRGNEAQISVSVPACSVNVFELPARRAQ